MNGNTILRISNLTVKFSTDEGDLRAVDKVNLDIKEGEAVGLVGESGCGKSTLALSILRLVPKPGHIVEGKIWFQGEDLLEKSESEMRKIRGKEISMVFQDPMNTLNPCYSIGWQIGEGIKLHERINDKALYKRCIKVLEEVKISDPPSRLRQFPHHFSGGMRQRTVLAMAIACRPKLVILDEPTTALDVTVQAKIMDLLQMLRDEFNLSMLLISHDLGLVMERCDRVAVMYTGQIVEIGTPDEMFFHQLHPYTYGLFKALPQNSYRDGRLYTIKGEVPDLTNLPKGCLFHPRCERAKEICVEEEPPFREIQPGRYCKCHFPITERDI